MASSRFQLAQVFLQFRDAGRKYTIRSPGGAFETAIENAAEHEEETRRRAENQQATFPEQRRQKEDQDQDADAETESHPLRHQEQLDKAQLLLFNFIAEKF
jgi:hypothetical protein